MPAPPPSEPKPKPKPTPRSLWLPRLLGLAGMLLALVFVVAGAGSWLLRSEAGAAWVVEQLPGGRVTASRGALLPDFAAQRIEIDLPAPAGGAAGRVLIDEPRWRGLRIERSSGTRWLRLAADSLDAARVTVLPARGGPARGDPPASLALPIEIEIGAARIGELRVGAPEAEPLRDLRARVHLGADGGDLHRIDDAALLWRDIAASGAARIGTAAPLQVNLQAVLSGGAAPAPAASAPAASAPAASALPTWQARVALTGPLAQLGAKADATARPRPGRAEPSLQATATLRPFAPWPIGALQATTQALDLAAFDARLPATSITGSATVTSVALDQPASIDATLENALPGRWSESKLPVRRLRLALRARPDDAATLDITAFEAQLGTDRFPAGAVRGEGQWTRARWSLKAMLDAVEPARLDTRAPSMRLSGPVRVTGAAGVIEAEGNLDGRDVAGAKARDATLRFALRSDADTIELREARLAAGRARADAVVKLLRPKPADDRWRASGRLALAEFDPLPWWPGAESSRWRRGPHRIDADGTFDLAIAAKALDAPARERLAALRGNAALTLKPSVLAGVPVAGQVTLNSRNGPAEVALAIESEGNRLRLDGRARVDGDGSADRWDIALDAPALARLAPVWKLVAPNDPALAGSARGSARVEGRWPALATSGRLDAEGVRAGPLRAARANARWSIGSHADAALTAQLDLAQLAYGERSLESATLRLDGTARAHRLALDAQSKALPPGWAEDVQAATGAPSAQRGAKATRSILALAGDGGFLFDTAEPGATPAGWRGRIEKLELRGDNGSSWLRAGDLVAQARWAGGPRSFQAEPGRVLLLGAALRWDRIAWQEASGNGAAQLSAKAELEPLAIAPLLARLQPSFGWGGDLAIAGRLDIRSAPEFAADVVIERARGDLSVTDEAGTQALGLSDLRLGLVASGGTWSFTQALAGSNVGVLGGAVIARTSPQATWPAETTPLEGVLELRVANLGTWGTWVPAGWRLGGALRVSASIGGRFGAPEYTGEVRGNDLSVRNFVEGVAIGDGDVAIALQGATARIERFTAKAGAGTVRLEGDGSFGAAPRADLRLVAEQFQLLGRVDRRIVTSGNARLRLDRDVAALEGRLRVDSGLIDVTRGDAPSLGGDVVVVRPRTNGVAPGNGTVRAEAAAASASAAPRGSTPLPRPALDLRVNLGEQLRLRGRGLDTGLRGELHLTSPGGKLAINGTVRADGGTYAAYGQKLAIDKGTLVFTGTAENPRLDIEATRPNIDVRVGVAIGGNAIDPRIRLFSEPEMADIDKLSWLVLGRASDGLGSTETALLQRAALALLAGEGQGPTDQLFAALGLDEVSVRRSDGEVRDTVVSLGKQLSRRWFVGYERGLNATTGNWQLVYRVARRFTLRAQAGGDNALDAIFTWRWQ